MPEKRLARTRQAYETPWQRTIRRYRENQAKESVIWRSFADNIAADLKRRSLAITDEGFTANVIDGNDH